MIRTFTSILFVLITVTGFSQTCNPDASFAGSPPGIYPITPLAPNCDLITPKTIVSLTDTIVEVTDPFPLTITAYIDAMRVLDVIGLPAELTFETDVMASADANSPYGVWYNTGTIPNQVSALGCAFAYGTGGNWDALINGGPNNDGVYPIEFVVDARVAQTSPDVSAFLPNGTWMSDPNYVSLTGGAFSILQEIVVLPGYDTINGIVSGETNPVPFVGHNYSVGANPDVTYNWSVTNGTITGGQGTNEVTVEWDGSPTGNVMVEMTDGGCYGTSDLDITANTVGIASSGDQVMGVWPNPSNGTFNLSGLNAGSIIQVTDVAGRIVLSQTANSNMVEVNLIDQPNGAYILRVDSKEGSMYSRLIKH